MRFHRIAAVSALAVLAGCSAPTAQPVATTPSATATATTTTTAATATPSPTTTTTTTTATTATTTTAAAPAQPPSVDSVTDPKGDAEAGVDLVGAKLVKVSGNLLVTWTLAGPVPSSGTAGFYLQTAAVDGSKAAQRGVKFDGGKKIAHFIAYGAKNTNLTGMVTASGSTVSAAFPLTELGPLGSTMTWRAVATAGGQDSDSAPDPGPSLLRPKTLLFDLQG